MDRPSLRKPKLHFDVVANVSHITFDDGKEQRRNIPWLHYVEARWEYAEPDTIKMEIGDWLVVISGHNLGPLLRPLRTKRWRVFAPSLSGSRIGEREIDTFVTEIRFMKPPAGSAVKRRGQIEFDLPG